MKIINRVFQNIRNRYFARFPRDRRSRGKSFYENLKKCLVIYPRVSSKRGGPVTRLEGLSRPRLSRIPIEIAPIEDRAGYVAKGVSNFVIL